MKFFELWDKMAQPYAETEGRIIMGSNRFWELSKLFYFPLWKQKTKKWSIIESHRRWTATSLAWENMANDSTASAVSSAPLPPQLHLGAHWPKKPIPESSGVLSTGCVARQTCDGILSLPLTAGVTLDTLFNISELVSSSAKWRL